MEKSKYLDYISTLNKYQSELSQYDLLDANTEIQLSKRVLEDNDIYARNILISSNLRLVYRIAKKYADSNEQLLLDLIQEGNVGLTIAAQKYDYTKGVRFSIFAGYYIQKYIFDYFNKAKLIKVPVAIYEKLKDLNIAKDYLISQGQNENSLERLNELTSLSDEEIIELSQYDFEYTSLDDTVFEDGSSLIDYLVLDNEEDSVLEYLVSDLIEVLNEDERELLQQYLGLNGNEPKTFAEIGEIHGITKQAVSQKYKKILKKLKEMYDK